MNHNTKRIIALVLTIVLCFGWYVTLFGLGSIAPIKDQIKLGLDIEGGVYVVMEAQTDVEGEELKGLMEQTQAVIEKRVNQMGLSEPVVTIEGNKKIRVELPGAENAEEAIEAIGRTAQLQFALADGTVVLDGSDIKTATTTTDSQNGGYAIALEFTKEGTAKFAEATEKAYSGQVVSTKPNVDNRAIMIILDDVVISSPVVQAVITGGTCEITSNRVGGYPQEEATETAALIRGGALPVALEEVNSGIQTAKIGESALHQSIISGAIGIALVCMVMLVAYSIMGLAATIALVLYILIVLWVLALLGSVLTLPGIAGIILSIGMALDTNVIIFTRIKEEIMAGKSIRVSIESGFKRAMNTVLDSQLTTVIAAVVLYQFGTSSVKGFALTLIIGILASLITAVSVTHLYLALLSETKRFSNIKYFGFKADGTPRYAIKKQFNFLKHRKKFYVISIAAIVTGMVAAGAFGMNYGIDFTGGTMMQLDFNKEVTTEQVNNVLKEHNINDAEIIYASEDNSEVIIRTTVALDNADRGALIKNIEAVLGEAEVLSSELFGPSVGDELKSNAVKAVLIAMLGMLIYIVIRFEWKFGTAALLGIAHDVLLVIACYALFRFSINNPFIAGILTVVGYSINDTIVIFDRIRENLGIMKKNHLEELVDLSINQTLSRSVMTSATTLIVMIPLFFMATDSVREFIMPLMIGIIVGCSSSITVCSPLYYELCNLTNGPKYKARKSKKSGKQDKAEKQDKIQK